jgi:hypothetical protein
MKKHAGIAILMLIAAVLQGQQPAAQSQTSKAPKSQAQPAPQEPSLEIYQVDLVPTGTGFALSKPVLEGDVYVLTVFPDRATVRVPKDRIKAITLRTKEMNAYSMYQIDLLPSGKMYAKEAPTLKGSTYTFRTWRDNTLISMRKSDVKAVTKLTGLAAFKAQQEERGAKLTANLPMQGGGTVDYISPEPAPPAPGQAQAPPPSGGTYWIYDGVPGITDAYAPPNATVAYPGDVPKAAEPQSPPHR